MSVQRIYCKSERRCCMISDLNFQIFTAIPLSLPNCVCRQTDSCPPSWGISRWMGPEPNIPLSHGWASNTDAQQLDTSCPLHGCCSPGGVTPPTFALAKQSGLTPMLLVTAAANLDYFDRTREKPHKCLPWRIKGKVTSVPCWAAARMFADGLGREQTFTTDMLRQWLPYQNGCPAPPWRSVVWIHVRGRRRLEAPKKHLFVCF